MLGLFLIIFSVSSDIFKYFFAILVNYSRIRKNNISLYFNKYPIGVEFFMSAYVNNFNFRAIIFLDNLVMGRTSKTILELKCTYLNCNMPVSTCILISLC